MISLLTSNFVRLAATQPESANMEESVKKLKEPKDYGFKIAPDGRIIIKDDNQKDDSDTENTKRKRLLSEDNTDDDDDYGNFMIYNLLFCMN